MRVDGEVTISIRRRAAAAASLLVEHRCAHAVRVAIKRGTQRLQRGELGEVPGCDQRQGADALIWRYRQIALDQLTARCAQIEAIAANEDLLRPQRLRVQ